MQCLVLIFTVVILSFVFRCGMQCSLDRLQFDLEKVTHI